MQDKRFAELQATSGEVKNKMKGRNASGNRFLRKKIQQELATRDTLKKTLAKKRDESKRRKTGLFLHLVLQSSLRSHAARSQSARLGRSMPWTASSLPRSSIDEC